MRLWFFIIVLLLSVITPGFGQERNFEVQPGNITCDNLPERFASLEEAQRIISSAGFRLKQNFKIRRKNGLKAGEYFSCNNETGYLLLAIDDTFQIFTGVTLEDWERLTLSSDPESMILDVFTHKYVKIPN